MIVTPVHTNSIKISLVQTGCCKSEFDSTYPQRLHGIISFEEFRESIQNINQQISSRKPRLFVMLICILLVIASIVLFVVGGILAKNSGTGGFPILIIIAMVVFIVAFLRSPKPCSWRLNAFRYVTGRYRGHRRVVVIYSLMIDIGNSVVPTNQNIPSQYNQVAPRPVSTFNQQNGIPPPYSGQPVGRFCSQCGTPRQNLTAKFCPSCGQAF
ncbi:unnamed protein product [Adineta steineri]|uniref:Zinc-ribbon domain-containing protein n=1 Tax=Adineta steineri TaxID=433720 RepID=A0A813SJF2_9BILA|nr:unnamed protein product [Adineta steineri]CAF0795948.1 unnamed protein product [Adineta steineri]